MLIELTEHTGRKILVNTDEIVKITQAGDSGAWHGINSYLKTTDGQTVELRDTVRDVQAQLRG